MTHQDTDSLTEYLQNAVTELREKAVGNCPNSNPDCAIPECRKQRALADLIDGVLQRHTIEEARTVEDCRRTACCEGGCLVHYCGGCGALVDAGPCPDLEDLATYVSTITGSGSCEPQAHPWT